MVGEGVGGVVGGGVWGVGGGGGGDEGREARAVWGDGGVRCGCAVWSG